jgi:hypothetical protein
MPCRPRQRHSSAADGPRRRHRRHGGMCRLDGERRSRCEAVRSDHAGRSDLAIGPEEPPSAQVSRGGLRQGYDAARLHAAGPQKDSRQKLGRSRRPAHARPLSLVPQVGAKSTGCWRRPAATSCFFRARRSRDGRQGVARSAGIKTLSTAATDEGFLKPRSSSSATALFCGRRLNTPHPWPVEN